MADETANETATTARLRSDTGFLGLGFTSPLHHNRPEAAVEPRRSMAPRSEIRSPDGAQRNPGPASQLHCRPRITRPKWSLHPGYCAAIAASGRSGILFALCLVGK